MQNELEEFTRVLLNPAADFGSLDHALKAMFGRFSELATVKADSETSEDAREVDLPSGKAVSPLDAARCVTDIARTTQYLQGIHAGVHEALLRFDVRPIEILYAGCGPYATLALPLFTRFSPADVTFTVLEINERSICSAKKVIESYGYQHFIREWILDDAATYRHPGKHPLHLFFTETMQRALAKESQVMVTANLARQLEPNGLGLPESVIVDACLMDVAREFQLVGSNQSRYRIALETVFSLTPDRAASLDLSDPRFSAVLVDIPDFEYSTPLNLALLTTVKIFGDIHLKEYDSGITYPVILHDFGAVQPGERFEFQYQIKPQPGFKCRRKRNPAFERKPD